MIKNLFAMHEIEIEQTFIVLGIIIIVLVMIIVACVTMKNCLQKRTMLSKLKNLKKNMNDDNVLNFIQYVEKNKFC